jgi:glutamyl-tRNA reductase
MSVSLLGVNHKTAPVELRERLAIPEQHLAEAIRELAHHPGVRGGLILSTCNRVEFLTAHDTGQPNLLEFVGQYFSIEADSLRPHLYEYHEGEAARHLFRVASSLDSMVVGEPQILGQVRQSFSVARSVGAINGELDALMRRTLTVAKRVRAETRVGASSVSIASVAVDLARKIFGSLQGKTVCLVGAGKMGKLAARALLAQGAANLLVSNRTVAGAEDVAEEFGGTVVPFDQLLDRLDAADIVITTTGSAEPIFRREHGQQLLQRRRSRPMFFIDIAVPRDVDPEMARLEGIFVYDIDDLQGVAAQNHSGRTGEAAHAETIIDTEVERYRLISQSLDARPAILGLQRAFENIRQTELRRSALKLATLNSEEREAVESLTRGLLKKLMHGPLMAIKTAARDGDAATLEAVERAFDSGQEAPIDEDSNE